MNTLNTISIRGYLAGKNIHPVKHYGYYGMYYSPIREDRNASFKVDFHKNLWKDFGTDEGGTLIDIVMHMEHCSFHEAAGKLKEKYAGMEVVFFLSRESSRQTTGTDNDYSENTTVGFQGMFLPKT
ncbi:DNA primase [termite gut metagenome]|uniref:DNA primase n=1 Tax=termite gut metagenome TaxID=433724 RepID=A0A5J4RNB5_9ZZZZ